MRGTCVSEGTVIVSELTVFVLHRVHTVHVRLTDDGGRV